MRLQRASRLALYAVLELAGAPERQLSAAEIAEKYGVSINHLAKVMRELGRAGLVESARGVGGGFRFSGNAKRTTLMDVISLFETISARESGPGEPGEDTETGQALAQVLDEIDEIAWATLHSITLSTMLKLTERRRQKAAE
jgi:Rrf2 family protein